LAQCSSTALVNKKFLPVVTVNILAVIYPISSAIRNWKSYRSLKKCIVRKELIQSQLRVAMISEMGELTSAGSKEYRPPPSQVLFLTCSAT